MTDLAKLKAIVAKGNEAHFTRYFDGNLWYIVYYTTVSDIDGHISADAFEFPIPTSDIGNATFNVREKALFMMRYIRKHMDMLEKAKAECEV